MHKYHCTFVNRISDLLDLIIAFVVLSHEYIDDEGTNESQHTKYWWQVSQAAHKVFRLGCCFLPGQARHLI